LPCSFVFTTENSEADALGRSANFDALIDHKPFRINCNRDPARFHRTGLPSGSFMMSSRRSPSDQIDITEKHSEFRQQNNRRRLKAWAGLHAVGHFDDLDGQLTHDLDRGQGDPVVLIHRFNP
jgi:hypothetical protein